MAGKPKRNWTYWKIRFAQECKRNSKLTVEKFCEQFELNYTTAKRYIKKKDNAKLLKKLDHEITEIDAFCDMLREVRTEDDAKRYLSALRQSLELTESIMVDSVREFKKGIALGEGLPPGEAGRLALDAAERLRKVALELQGAPADDEDFGWPLTKRFWPHWYQRDFVFDFPSTLKKQGKEAFIFAFIGGIRSGKTFSGAQKFGELCWRNRGCTLAVYAPTYRMLEDATKKTFLEVLHDKGISYHYNKSENKIILFGDTTVLFRSMDDPEHLRGPTLAGAWIDEGGQMKTDAAFRVIQGRVSDPAGEELCILVTTTPDGLGWLYDILVEEKEKHHVVEYHARTDWNHTLPQGYFDRLDSSFDERYAKQELGGEWIDIFAGQAYWNFSRTKHIIKGDRPYDRALPLIIMFDLNVDPMCWNIGQAYNEGKIRITKILDEIHLRSAATEHAAKEFAKRYRGHKAGVIIYGDSTCRHRSTKTTRTDYEIIMSTLKEKKFNNVEMRIGKNNPRVTDRIAAHNAQLLDLKGRVHLFIHESCTYTIRDYEKVAIKPGTRDLDKTSDPSLTHHTDAIGYYIAKEFPVRGIKVNTAA